MSSGVYRIESLLLPERIYVGSSCNLRQRWRQHLDKLRKNNHHSPKLQNHYNKYGESDLVFIIIEPCLPEFLLIREQYYIDTIKPYFNCLLTAGNCRGVRRSPETVEKIRLALTGRKQSDETRTKRSQSLSGITRSEKTRKKMSENHVGMLGKIPWNKGLKKEDDLRIQKQAASRKAKYETNGSYWSGKKHKDSTEQKISQSNKERVNQGVHNFLKKNKKKKK